MAREIKELLGVFLPTGPMLMVGRIRDLEQNRIVCELDLHDHWVFSHHFPNDPIFPGTLIVEGAGQTIAVWAWENGMRGQPRLLKTSAEFDHPVMPADGVLSFHASIRSRRNLCVGQVEVWAGGRLTGRVKVTLAVLAD